MLRLEKTRMSVGRCIRALQVDEWDVLRRCRAEGPRHAEQ